MKRTTAVGNASNLYTEGNPSLGVPATVIGADEMNNIQEELCGIVEGAGATLNAANRGQVLAAILKFIKGGGQATSFVSLANNQATAANVDSLIFDAGTVQAVQIPFSISRVTSSAHLMENGTIFLAYDNGSGTWRISVHSNLDDSGVTFGVTAQGQLTYTSTNMSGTGYLGTVRIAGVLVFSA